MLHTEHIEKTNAIYLIRPNSAFVLRGEEVEWLDEEQSEPTKQEIEEAIIAYRAKVQADKIANETSKALLLKRLGITEEEARLLLS